MILLALAIFTCTLPDGHRISTDREIAGCMTQAELRADGSVKRAVPAPRTFDERARDEQIDRDAEAMRESVRSVQRRDSNLLRRYPSFASHAAARERALRPVETAMRSTAARMSELQAKRRGLLEKAQFYTAATMPTWLQLALDSNAAAQIGQRQASQSQMEQVQQINTFYDDELAHLRTLWGQAQ